MSERMTDEDEGRRPEDCGAKFRTIENGVEGAVFTRSQMDKALKEQSETIAALVEALSFLMLHGDKVDGHDIYCACPAQTDRKNALHSTACDQGIAALRRAGALK